MLTAEWSGKSYEFVEELPAWGSCATEDGAQMDGGLDLRTTISLTPTEFTETGAGWQVASFEGRRILDWTPTSEAETRGCEPSVVEYSVTAIPYDPTMFEIPVGEPLPSGSLVFRHRGSEGVGLVVKGLSGTERFVEGILEPYAVSPDGATAVYGSHSSLWLAALDGGDPVEFFSDTRIFRRSELAWSADGARVAFVRDNLDEGADVWTVQVPYGVPERITEGGAALGGVSWGPDDETLLFDWGIYEEDTFEVTSAIYSYEFETGEIVEVAATGIRPAIGGGGQILTFLVPHTSVSVRPDAWTIKRAGVDGSNPTNALFVALDGCTRNHVIPCRASVSPDGNQVAFSDLNKCEDCRHGAFDEAGVWVLDLTTNLTSQVAESGGRPQWIK